MDGARTHHHRELISPLRSRDQRVTYLVSPRIKIKQPARFREFLAKAVAHHRPDLFEKFLVFGGHRFSARDAISSPSASLKNWVRVTERCAASASRILTRVSNSRVSLSTTTSMSLRTDL